MDRPRIARTRIWTVMKKRNTAKMMFAEKGSMLFVMIAPSAVVVHAEPPTRAAPNRFTFRRPRLPIVPEIAVGMIISKLVPRAIRSLVPKMSSKAATP